jgi:hypothetical protein
LSSTAVVTRTHAWLVVAEGVVDHVLDHAGAQRLAARDQRVRTLLLLDVESHRRDRVGAALDRSAGEVGERDRRLVGQRPVLGVGEGEEVLQQPVDAVKLAPKAPLANLRCGRDQRRRTCIYRARGLGSGRRRER